MLIPNPECFETLTFLVKKSLITTILLFAQNRNATFYCINSKQLFMDVNNFNPFLRLQAVRKDEHLFELKVTASNGRYFGTTDVYDTPEPILKFAETLIGFPQDNSDLLYETGFKNEYSSFSMHFYRIDKAGHIAVEVNLEDNIKTAFKYEQKNKIRIEMAICMHVKYSAKHYRSIVF